MLKAVFGFFLQRIRWRQEDMAAHSAERPNLSDAPRPPVSATLSPHEGEGQRSAAVKAAWGNLLVGDVATNQIEVGENVALSGEIRGKGNIVLIEGTRNLQKVHLIIHGNGNVVKIGSRSVMRNVKIEIGSKRWASSRSRLEIGNNFSMGSRSRILLPNSGNVIEIGDDCMFSNSVQLRGGEYPHLIFDKETGANLDVSDGIFVGNHVWVGEGAFLGKSSSIPDDCIVGTRSVVTKRFSECHAVIAGNPARVVKSGVQWVANEFLIEMHHPDMAEGFSDSQVNRINLAERESEVAPNQKVGASDEDLHNQPATRAV